MGAQPEFRHHRLVRRILDHQLLALGPISRFTAPEIGWIRTVRKSLGLSAAELARLMGVTEGAVRSIERNEQAGAVRIDTARRAAAAMDCTAVFVLIPNHSLEYTVRLRRVAKQRPEVQPGDMMDKLMPKLNVGPTNLGDEYWHGHFDWMDQ